MVIRVGDFGNNTLAGVKGEFNYLYGDNDVSYSGATGGSDNLTGGANATNYVYGDAPDIMGIGASGGNDTLTGGANSTNYLYGDAETMTGAATGGNDTLIGGKGGVNHLYGDAVSPGGPSTGGNDRLVSAANTTDNMWGDFGSVSSYNTVFGQDTFVFGPRNGNDYIHDYHQGEDIIEINSVRGVQSFENFNIQTVDVNGDGQMDNSVIHLSANDSVTVYGVTGLTAADFNIVV
jgi:hypothetical protein